MFSLLEKKWWFFCDEGRTLKNYIHSLQLCYYNGRPLLKQMCQQLYTRMKQLFPDFEPLIQEYHCNCKVLFLMRVFI